MDTIALPTRQIEPKTLEILKSLKPGDKFKVTQTVRCGAKVWSITTNGIFRSINYLATGVTTDRIPEDDIVVPTLHFKKDNGELASVAIDENTKVEKL